MINVQESFLNVALAAGKHITVHLLNGAKISGSMRCYDKYSIVLETSSAASSAIPGISRQHFPQIPIGAAPNV